MHPFLILTALSSASLSLARPLHFDVTATSRRNLRRSTFEAKSLNDIMYTTKIIVGASKQVHDAQLDIGSSTFWVAPPVDDPVSDSVDTGSIATSNYVELEMDLTGPIKTASLDFAGFTIHDQSYIEVFEEDYPSLQVFAMIGLGPDKKDPILRTLKSHVGYSPLHRIFLQDKSLPHIMTMLLGRSLDPTDPFPGKFTVGSILEGFEKIQEQPKIPVAHGRHFTLLLDEDSIVAPGDKIISATKTRVNLPDSIANPKRLTAFVDSGFSFNQVPKKVADAFYSGYPKAQYFEIQDIGPVWLLPCRQEVEIMFKIGGEEIYIHPLDATFHPRQFEMEEIEIDDEEDMCIGSFQPIHFKTNELDIILASSFLRNVYALTNFGEAILGDEENPETVSDGYMQFMARTDPKKAHKDFEKARCGGKPC